MTEDWREDIIKNKLGGKKDWTDQERQELSHQLDKDLEESLKNCKKKSSTEDDWTEANWKEKMGEHPIFAPFLHEEGDDEIMPMSALSEGLAQLKYDPEHNTLREVAVSYKEEGVVYFKLKKYRLAIVSFNEGIKQKCCDEELISQLYNNRAAAHFFLGNHRSSLNDCKASIANNSTYLKPVIRAIDCCVKLEKYDEGIAFGDFGLQVDSTHQIILKKRAEAVICKKRLARDLRRKKKEEKLQEDKQRRLFSIIISRGVTILPLKSYKPVSAEDLALNHLEPCHPQAQGSSVFVNDDGDLVWPLIFMYPEYTLTDFILKANENSSVYDHLNMIFGPESEKAPWDEEAKYKIEDLFVVYEDLTASRMTLVSVDQSQSLRIIFSDKRYCIRGGTPTFIVLVKNSEFMKSFMEKYR